MDRLKFKLEIVETLSASPTNKSILTDDEGSSSDRGSFRVTRSTEDFPANGRASFRRVLGMGSAEKECDLRRERNSLHWSGSSSPIGRTGRSEEKGELAQREKIISRERYQEILKFREIHGN
ncbi:hypothetical protein TNCV_3696721 [Trichonephila clavipes]|uniref:Uncharacterized protein n=1 Tax=Trichonephila clavipes TaxID=2585209 RepID=A0A8X6VKS2_TRICX|nr:hypothetical protein TNCV_3696721 [Trichonephila clavipes]